MNVETFPVQSSPRNRKPATVPKVVAMRAYEIYSKLYGDQESLVKGDCRGGFSANELIAFLYARSFPPEEWTKRTDEAFAGLNV